MGVMRNDQIRASINRFVGNLIFIIDQLRRRVNQTFMKRNHHKITLSLELVDIFLHPAHGFGLGIGVNLRRTARIGVIKLIMSNNMNIGIAGSLLASPRLLWTYTIIV
ncbi:hypothetical protein D3C77_645940 [compost metagenome]